MSSTKPSVGTAWKGSLLMLLLHCIFLAVASITIGFFLEAKMDHFWYNTGLEAYSPMIALVALLSGYIAASPSRNGRVAAWMWTVGIAWFALGVYDVAWGSDAWNPAWAPEKTRWAYLIAQFLVRRTNVAAVTVVLNFSSQRPL